jgi:chromosomal replication initiation ATPase DnaA
MQVSTAPVTAGSLASHYRAVRERLDKGIREYRPEWAFSFIAMARFLPNEWPDRPPVVNIVKERCNSDAQIAKRLVAQVCRHFDVTLEDLRGPRRYGRLADARLRLYYLLRHGTQWSFPHIGRYLNRDPSSVMTGVQRYCKRNGIAQCESEEHRNG